MAEEIASVGIKLDTAGVERGIKSLETLAAKGPAVERSMSQVEQSVKKTGKSLDDISTTAPKSIEAVGKGAAKAAEGLNKVTGSADNAAKAVKAVGVSTAGLEKLNSSATSGAASVKKLATSATASERGIQQMAKAASSAAVAINAEVAALGKARAATALFAAQQAASAKSMEDFQRAVGGAAASIESLTAKSRQLAEIDRHTDRAAVGIRNVKGAADETAVSMFAVARAGASAFVGSALVLGAANASKAMYEASAAAERLQTMLNFASGGNGAREIEYLRGVTQDLGLQFSSTSIAYGQFQAAAKGTALEGQKARDVFESIAKASAVMGLSADQTSGVLLALQQMISKGNVQAEELRGQLGERLPGAFQIAAKAMGVTTAELGKMLEQGEVVADDFLPKFARALEENLGGAAERAADRLDAAVNRFDSAWERLKRTAGNSGVSQAINTEIKAITSDITAVSDAMDNVARSGGGMVAQFSAGGGVAAGRMAFGALNLAANAVNGTINLLSGGVVKLRTDLSYLPGILKTNAAEMATAEMRLKDLQDRGAQNSPNIYLRSAYFDARKLVDELRAVKLAQDALAGISNNPRDQSAFTSRGQSYENEAKRRAAIDAEVNKYLSESARQTKDQSRDEEVGLARKRAAELVAKAEGDTNAQLKIQAALKTEIANITTKYADKGAASSAKSEQSAYDNLSASIREKIQVQELEIGSGEKLTESQWLRLQIERDYTGARKSTLKVLADQLDAIEQEGKAVRMQAQHAAEAAKSYADLVEARQSSVSDIQQQIQREKDVAAAIGLTRLEITELEVAKLEESAASKERRADYLDEIDLSKQAGKLYREEAKHLRDLAAAKRNTAVRQESVDAAEAASDAAKKASEDWQRYTDDINRSLTDALLRGFEDGKGFAENMRDTVVNMFKTMVLRPVISAVLSPISGAVGGLTNGVLNSVGMGGGNNVLGMASNANSLYGAYQGYQAGLGILGGSGTLGSYVTGASSIAPWTQAAANVAPDSIAFLNAAQGWTEVASTAGATAGAAAAATTLGTGAVGGGAAATVGGVSAGAIMGGVAPTAGASTAGMGALMSNPYGWIALAAIAAIAIFAGKGEKRSGGQYTVGDFTDEGAPSAINFKGGPSGGEIAGDYARELVTGTTKGINTLLSDLGSGMALTGFQAGLEQSGKGRGGVYSGGTLTGGLTFGESGQGDNYAGTLFEKTSSQSPNAEEAVKNFATDMLQVTVQALQAATDLPKVITAQLKGIDAEKLTDEAAQELLASISQQIEFVKGLREAIDQLPFPNLRDLSFDAAAGLIAAAGGLDQFNEGLSGYLSNYFSQEEQRKVAVDRTAAAFEALGLTMPTLEQSAEAARTQFRAMVEGIDITTEKGQEQYVGLLALQGAFAELTPVIDQAAEAARTAASAMQQRQQLEMQLLQARGETDEIRRRQLAELLNDQNRGLQQQIWDFQDQQSAAQAAAQAAQNASQAYSDFAQRMADSAAQVRESWKGVGDSLVDEIKRIRGEIVGDGAMGFSSAQAQFATTSAQARAGSLTAAEALPELSRTVLELAAENAKSALDLALIRSQIAASLEETLGYTSKRAGIKVPSLDTGTSFVPYDTLAQLHQGEAVIPARFNPFANGGATSGTSRTDALLEQLIADNRAQAGEILRLNGKLVKLTDKWDTEGLPAERVEA